MLQQTEAPKDKDGPDLGGARGCQLHGFLGGHVWWSRGLLGGKDAESAQVALPDARQLSSQLLVLLQDLRKQQRVCGQPDRMAAIRTTSSIALREMPILWCVTDAACGSCTVYVCTCHLGIT